MSHKVIGSLIIAIGVLTAIGVLPIRIGFPPQNRYWQTKPTNYATISRIGWCLFAVAIGFVTGWSSLISKQYRIFLSVPILVGFILAIGGEAMEMRVNPGPTIAALTLPDELARKRRESNLRLIIVVAVVLIFGGVLWSHFHH